MEIWTVVYVQECDVMPFVHSFKTHEQAIQAVEDNALDDYNSLFDPDDGETEPFPGLDWNESKTIANTEENDSDAGYWVIQKTELK